jgi:hypothetical protein
MKAINRGISKANDDAQKGGLGFKGSKIGIEEGCKESGI